MHLNFEVETLLTDQINQIERLDSKIKLLKYWIAKSK